VPPNRAIRIGRTARSPVAGADEDLETTVAVTDAALTGGSTTATPFSLFTIDRMVSGPTVDMSIHDPRQAPPDRFAQHHLAARQCRQHGDDKLGGRTRLRLAIRHGGAFGRSGGGRLCGPIPWWWPTKQAPGHGRAHRPNPRNAILPWLAFFLHLHAG
jgi:hypothetical protein